MKEQVRKRQTGSDFQKLLVARGLENGYLTMDDIVEIFPEPEKNVDWLAKTFQDLSNLGIEYVGDDNLLKGLREPTEEDLQESEADKKGVSDEFFDSSFEKDTIGIYLQDMEHELLSPNREVELAKKMEAGNLARKKLANKKVGAINKDKRSVLIKKVTEGYLAREELIDSNLSLVVSVPKS